MQVSNNEDLIVPKHQMMRTMQEWNSHKKDPIAFDSTGGAEPNTLEH